MTPIRQRFDRTGIALSALCAVHCLLSIVLVSAVGAGASLGLGALLHPDIHRIGLAVATLIAAVAIGRGALTHRAALPSVVAVLGLGLMGGALAVPHGTQEAALTVIGVTLLALGHVLNLRHLRGSCVRGCER